MTAECTFRVGVVVVKSSVLLDPALHAANGDHQGGDRVGCSGGASAPPVVVDIRDVHMRYANGVHAVKGVSVQVTADTAVGPSGVGESRLGLLYGLLRANPSVRAVLVARARAVLVGSWARPSSRCSRLHASQGSPPRLCVFRTAQPAACAEGLTEPPMRTSVNDNGIFCVSLFKGGSTISFACLGMTCLA
jgi:hypothetical protein